MRFRPAGRRRSPRCDSGAIALDHSGDPLDWAPSHVGFFGTSAAAGDIATEVATTLGIRGGYLLRSGASYRLLGDYLLTWDESTDLLARAQLLSPLIDHRWAAHQLIDRHCALRISTDESRHPNTHALIAATRAT